MGKKVHWNTTELLAVAKKISEIVRAKHYTAYTKLLHDAQVVLPPERHRKNAPGSSVRSLEEMLKHMDPAVLTMPPFAEPSPVVKRKGDTETHLIHMSKTLDEIRDLLQDHLTQPKR